MLQVTIPMHILFRVIYLHNVYINDTQAIYIKKKLYLHSNNIYYNNFHLIIIQMC